MAASLVAGFLISARIAAGTLLLSMPIGALAATGISGLSASARNALTAILTASLSVSLVLTGYGLLVFYIQLGLLDETGLIIGHMVVSVPYVLRPALVSMSLSSHSLPRAATLHGASPLQVIWHIILPLLRPGLLFGGLFAFLASINNIMVSAFIAQHGASPLPVVIFSRIENLAEPSVAAASLRDLLLAGGTVRRGT